MSDVRVVLKDQGVVKSALIHKGTLNAFHDPRWYGEGPLSHPLLSLFGDAPVAPEDAPYGTVAIDRETRWGGSCQGYMSLEAVDVWTGCYTLKQCQDLDLDAELAQLEPDLWSALLVQPPARLHLFQKAFDEGAFRFSPPGWTIQNYDPDDGRTMFEQVLAARELVYEARSVV